MEYFTCFILLDIYPDNEMYQPGGFEMEKHIPYTASLWKTHFIRTKRLSVE